MKFRKKPVVIEAEQFDLSREAIGLPLPFSGHGDPMCFGGMGDHWYIQTWGGLVIVKDKDWIIKGVKGEFYPCKPDIFEATYERVEE